MAVVTNSKTFTPSEYDSSSTWGSNNIQNPNNALNSEANTSSYARFRLYNSSYIAYYSFAVNGIPSNATINSVTCVLRAYVTNTNNTANFQLCNNTTAKGSSITVNTTSSSLFTIDNGGTWSVSELYYSIVLTITLKSSTELL